MDLVIDASVILKVVLTENEADQQVAIAIIKRFQQNKLTIRLPIFWTFEVGNILIRKTEQFEADYKSTLDLDFQTQSFSNEELIQIGIFAKNFKISYYDAAYHFLAKLLNSTFVTADEKYFNKTKEIGNIVLLKDFKI